MRFTIRSLEDCLSSDAPLSVRSRINHAYSEPPASVALPTLDIGRFFLDRMQVRELPGTAHWLNTGYESFASPLFVVSNAVLHTSAGILAMDDVVVEETLTHTSSATNGYRIDGRSIELFEHGRINLPGRHVSLLAGSSGNYFHSLIDSIARLAIVVDSGLLPVESLLIPRQTPKTRQLLSLVPPAWRNVVEIDDSDTIEVEHLVLPWTVHGQSSFHPCIKSFFSKIAESGTRSNDMPKRVYVSRLIAGNRRLSNEAELIEALADIGVVAVALETLSLDEQIRLFRAAELVVAPHGAGLSNIVFATPKLVVLELLMDSYVNWCFRHLAAMLGIRYDCVIGRADFWSELSPAVHGDEWVVSIPHVVAAARTLLGR